MSTNATRYLLCALSGGLSNQENMVNNCIQAAAASGRAMVMPRPHLHAAGPLTLTGKTDPFSALWSEQHLVQYAHAQFGVEVVNEAEFAASGAVVSLVANVSGFREQWYLNYVRPNGSIASIETVLNDRKEQKNRALVMRQLLDGPMSSHRAVLLRLLFCVFSCPGAPGEDCCRPNEQISRRVDAFRRTLPEAFHCVHARSELDWFRLCCPRPVGRDEASMLHHATAREQRGLCEHSGEAPPVSCFVPPARLAEFLQSDAADPPLGLYSTLFVASGLDKEDLRPLSNAFDMRQLPLESRKESRFFMSYSEALAQRTLCASASRFFGVAGSTFTTAIAEVRAQRGIEESRAVEYYAAINWAQRPTDNVTTNTSAYRTGSEGIADPGSGGQWSHIRQIRARFQFIDRLSKQSQHNPSLCEKCATSSGGGSNCCAAGGSWSGLCKHDVNSSFTWRLGHQVCMNKYGQHRSSRTAGNLHPHHQIQGSAPRLIG